MMQYTDLWSIETFMVQYSDRQIDSCDEIHRSLIQRDSYLVQGDSFDVVHRFLVEGDSCDVLHRPWTWRDSCDVVHIALIQGHSNDVVHRKTLMMYYTDP